MDDRQIAAIAAEVLAAGDATRTIPPLSRRYPGFGLREAYAVSAEIARRRVGRGERRVGWKIGFTNTTIWDEYDVHAPIWGPMYDTTFRMAEPGAVTPLDTRPTVQPRIEPEIAFRFAMAPDPSMDEAGLLGCIDGVAHGFEIVQSHFPDCKFTAADTAAAFALHGRYVCGPFTAIASAEDRRNWLTLLGNFEIVLSRGGAFVDRGKGANVLGGPLTALRHFVRGVAGVGGPGVVPGEIVTTGTITRAFPVAAGEIWRSAIIGLPLPGLALAIS